jgi:hypothetical protein
MESEKNIYGLAEGVYKACLHLGFKFPSEPLPAGEHFPSDYFGDDFDFDQDAIEKLRAEAVLSVDKFTAVHRTFIERFYAQKPIKHTKTDLSVYFCDYLLFCFKPNDVAVKNYFYYEFYNKSFELRDTFLLIKHSVLRRHISNEHYADAQFLNKARANELLSDFLHRDWLNTLTCSYEEFQVFVRRHSRFFSKLAVGSQGKGAAIVDTESNKNLRRLFNNLKSRGRILEEVVNQHEAISAFCADTVNTIRINTFLDTHNVVNILTASGRFGSSGNVTDNFTVKGYAVIIDPKTGIIISEGMNSAHERVQTHPDTGKTFKGFQYPSWEKVRAVVTQMAMRIPQIRHIGWDIAINEEGEPVLIEVNVDSGVGVQQAPDSVGRLHLYQPLLDEVQNYNADELRFLGYRANILEDFDLAYETSTARQDFRLRYALLKLIPDCASILDLGCRETKSLKGFCPANVKYIPVDFKNYDDDEIIACDFNGGEFPDVTADVCLCAFTAEFVELLPQFLNNICRAAQKQILFWACPADKEIDIKSRWENPFLTDFTEEFLIKTIEQNNFKLNAQYTAPDNVAAILYDFRKK